jgi:deoxyribodipyrimidine photo-lyase
MFTRDLRVRDNPALAAAVLGSARVLPLFVLDDAILARQPDCPNRLGFLVESLRDLDSSLRALGGGLVVRTGNWVEEVLRAVREVGAVRVHVADDFSGYARSRLSRLEEAASALRVEVVRHPGVTVVPPGEVSPSGGGEFKVFTPYHRAWSATQWRRVVPRPTAIALPDGVRPAIGVLDRVPVGVVSPGVPAGGETAGTARLRSWAARHLREYAARHDDLPGDATSRISPYLHLGCLSPLEVAARLLDRPGGEAFVRQLCWRDFYHQVLAARPEAAWEDYRNRGRRWRDDEAGLEAWRQGSTGYPVVDAGMRQLAQEGFMHNRARMIVASFLTKDLYVDWRSGAAHFMSLLVDGDVANNQLNWQWTAGTGTDTNRHRVFNPTVQGRRFDPSGEYVRRYIPELAAVDGAAVHDPDPDARHRCGYPMPIVDHREAIASYRARIRG